MNLLQMSSAFSCNTLSSSLFSGTSSSSRDPQPAWRRPGRRWRMWTRLCGRPDLRTQPRKRTVRTVPPVSVPLTRGTCIASRPVLTLSVTAASFARYGSAQNRVCLFCLMVIFSWIRLYLAVCSRAVSVILRVCLTE